MVVGAGMTFVVQSSSVFTSAITPLIGEFHPCLVPIMMFSGCQVLRGAFGVMPPWKSTGVAVMGRMG